MNNYALRYRQESRFPAIIKKNVVTSNKLETKKTRIAREKNKNIIAGERLK